MRKLKIVLLIALAIATPKFLENDYTLTTVVVQVTKPCDASPEGLVKCEAENGRVITFEGSEDWIEGDIAELTMNDNATAYRTDDDIVKKALYKGYIY